MGIIGLFRQMKVFELLNIETKDNAIRDDIRNNKGKAVISLVKGAKRKTNPTYQPISGVDPEEEISRMG